MDKTEPREGKRSHDRKHVGCRATCSGLILICVQKRKKVLYVLWRRCKIVESPLQKILLEANTLQRRGYTWKDISGIGR